MSAGTEILPLTSLRFLAALYVFLFHVHIRWPLADSAFLSNVLNLGAVGMSFFFVLSGYILAYTYADLRTGLRDYLINRIARIYPIYFLAAVVTLPWIGVNFAWTSPRDAVWELGKLSILVITQLFMIQAWLPELFWYWNNGGSWSLSVEAFFYVLLPFMLPLLVGRSNKQLVIIVIVVYLLAILPGASVMFFGSAPSPMMFYSMPIFRLAEFTIGIITFLLSKGLRGGSSNDDVPLLLLIGALIVYLGLAGPLLPIYVTHNWLVVPTIALTIFSLGRNPGRVAAFLSMKPFVWTGKVSYCFYSFQALFILALLDYRSELVTAVPLLSNNWVLSVATFSSLLLVSAIGYHWIEEPARRSIRKWWVTPSPSGPKKWA